MPEVREISRAEEDRERHHDYPDRDRPGEPSPTGRGEMAVGEQQQHEDARDADDRYPRPRGRCEGGGAAGATGLERVGAVDGEWLDGEEPDHEHQPVQRVPGSPRCEHHTEPREEQNEGQQVPGTAHDVGDNVPAVTAYEDREPDADAEEDELHTEQRPGEPAGGAIT